MSEYQYYDFRALDRPLTPRQQSALRTLSVATSQRRTVKELLASAD